MTTIKSNESDAHTHETAFNSAAAVLENSARIGADRWGCCLDMFTAVDEVLEATESKATALAAALRERAGDVKAVHGGLEETDQANAGRLASV